MRPLSVSASFLLIALLGGVVPGPARAAPLNTAAPVPEEAEQKPSEQAKPARVKIVPHRAIYNMSLASVKNGSNITGVSGRMFFEWSDVCDGWAVQQHLQLHFNYAQGDQSNVTSTVISWESKDGKRYNFNVRRLNDGKETDIFRGKAVLAADGGHVTYTSPKDKTLKLSKGDIFPSTHTELLIRNALSGEKLFTRRIFDGSDEEGISDISAFIGPPLGEIETTDLSPKLKDNPLLDQPGWPIRLAFFKLNTETGEPDYEMNLTLLSNGVAREMRLDYGDFSVGGTLSDIEALPPVDCKN
ncbi:MAG: cell envelope integrity EipB family protein [Bdellovibrionales bacterium]